MSVMRIMSVIIMRVFSEIGFFLVIMTITLIRVIPVICAMSVTKVNLVLREISVTRAVIRIKKENAFVKD